MGIRELKVEFVVLRAFFRNLYHSGRYMHAAKNPAKLQSTKTAHSTIDFAAFSGVHKEKPSRASAFRFFLSNTVVFALVRKYISGKKKSVFISIMSLMMSRENATLDIYSPKRNRWLTSDRLLLTRKHPMRNERVHIMSVSWNSLTRLVD